MNAHAHSRSHRERKVCPYVRARNAARTSPPRTSKKWCEGTSKGEQKTDKGEKNARRRPRATEVKHNTKKKTHKHKLNIHTWLVGSKYVACHATLRHEHETRTATTPTKVKGDHEA